MLFVKKRIYYRCFKEVFKRYYRYFKKHASRHPESWRGYIKYSIRGNTNRLQNIVYNFFHLQMFNIRYKIVHLQVVWCQIFVIRKSCLLQKEENGCLWSYGRMSLVLDFKLTLKNDGLLSSRHEVPHPLQEYTKMRIPKKRYATNTLPTF